MSPEPSGLTLKRTGVLTLLFGLVILAHYVTKPARDAYITVYWGSQWVPYIGIGVLLLTFLISRLTSKAYSRTGPRLLLPYVASAALAYYVVFPLLLGSSAPAATLGLAAIMTLYNLFGLAFAWGAIDSCYRSQGSWPSFAVIGTGGPIGAVVGGFAATTISAHWGPYGTLLTGAALITATAFLYVHVVGWRLPDKEVSRQEFHAPSHTAGLLQDNYVRGLLLFSLFGSCVSAVFKWSIFRLAELNGGNSAELTRYFAGMYTNIGVVSLVAQLVFTTASFRVLGPRRSLLVVPVLVVFAGVVGLLVPDVRALNWIVIGYLGLDYTLNQCSKELAYVPTSEEVRFRGKAYIDSSGKQAGAVFGNFLLIFVTAFLTKSPFAVGGVIVLLGLLWILGTAPLWRRPVSPEALAPATESP